MTTVVDPRYAPEDPTLPKPWIGLLDGKTGDLYFWNPETNITQYERPGGNTNSGSASQQKPSSTSISSSVQVQQSSKRKHRDNSYNDDGDRYNKSSNSWSKFDSEPRNYEGGSGMLSYAPDSIPLNDEELRFCHQLQMDYAGSSIGAMEDYMIPYEDESMFYIRRHGRKAYDDYVTYCFEVDESDGFDVNTRSSMFLPGGIQPVNLDIEDCRVKCVGFAKFAIEAFNTREKDSEGKLKFGSLLKATFRGGYAYSHHLTFVAENLVNKCIGTYQAVVEEPCRGENKVLAFRPKPKGSRHKQWYWDDRCCKEETEGEVEVRRLPSFQMV